MKVLNVMTEVLGCLSTGTRTYSVALQRFLVLVGRLFKRSELMFCSVRDEIRLPGNFNSADKLLD
jgi:hypothetical protein